VRAVGSQKHGLKIRNSSDAPLTTGRFSSSSSSVAGASAAWSSEWRHGQLQWLMITTVRASDTGVHASATEALLLPTDRPTDRTTRARLRPPSAASTRSVSGDARRSTPPRSDLTPVDCRPTTGTSVGLPSVSLLTISARPGHFRRRRSIVQHSSHADGDSALAVCLTASTSDQPPRSGHLCEGKPYARPGGRPVVAGAQQ